MFDHRKHNVKIGIRLAFSLRFIDCVISFVPLLLLISSPPPFNQQAKNIAIADYQLIQTLCHNSETPETCLKCVQTLNGADKANSVGIATIIVSCINDHANTLAFNMTTLASTTSNQNLKSLYKRCANNYGYHIAKKDLVLTKHALQNHKYDNAEFYVIKALKYDLTCHTYLGSYQNKVPFDVFYAMKTYEDLSEAACRIIEKLYV
ncbi:hypothetical protein VNO77_27856 [Canavalia gladiata]|uniref:Pectinesterase inhibitor domain-containing protein n=1 Tax=Canavalia gladiata TaxID=3824 RepID=A0AAN9KZM7_CANGL